MQHLDNILVRMHPFPDARSVLVLDNCSIHGHEIVRARCDAARVRCIFLPAYSPDLNPIEFMFHDVRCVLRRYGRELETLTDKASLEWAFNEMQEETIRKHIRHCGYCAC